MNTHELVKTIADSAEIPTATAHRAVEAMIKAIAATLKNNGEVSLSGFGTFSVVTREVRSGRHPRTGEIIEFKATRAPRFRADKPLREAIK
jgi:DNA-binding protein HU-beta